MTARAAADTFGLALVEHEAAAGNLERRFREWGREMPEAARKQATLPEGCEPIDNPVGTACGFLIRSRGVEFMFLPGVPEEVHAMAPAVVAAIAGRCGLRRVIRSRTLKVFGLWESKIQEMVAGRLPGDTGVALGFYPTFPEVSLKITAAGADAGEVGRGLDRFQQALHECLGDYIYSDDNESLEAVAGRLLAGQGATIAVAESCTGGLITHRLTNVAGSSAYVERSFVVYSNRAKQELLGVPGRIIAEHGAVSEPVARLMAEGCRTAAGTTYGLSVTGIAGPGGGTPEKPVGTAYIGFAGPGDTTVKKIFYPGTREKIKIMVSQLALDMLRKGLSGQALAV
jgi:nicotinamide-nucleotide amidase